MLANYSVTYSAIDTQGINYFYTKILHLAFLHCAGPETDHVTYIPLNALEILMPNVDSINIYSIDGMDEKPSVSAFQNFLQIENRLNIKKVMDRNVWMCFVLTVSAYIVFEATVYRVEFSNLITLYTVLCKCHKHQY